MRFVIGLDNVDGIVKRELLKKGIDERISFAMDVGRRGNIGHIPVIKLPLSRVYEMDLNGGDASIFEKKFVPIFYTNNTVPNAIISSEYLTGFGKACQYQVTVKENAVYYREVYAGPNYIDELLVARVTKDDAEASKKIITEGVNYALNAALYKSYIQPVILLDQKVEQDIFNMIEMKGLKRVK